MSYFAHLGGKFGELLSWLDVRKEQGADMQTVTEEIARFIDEKTRILESLEPPQTNYYEPNELAEIRNSRPDGPRKLAFDLTDDQLYDKMLGAWLGRGAGCVLGIPVEGRSREDIKAWAEKIGQPYPLNDYWRDYIGLPRKHYSEPIENFILPIDHLGPDDDLTYTVLGLLILEKKGLNFTANDVGELWVKYLPMACTAERVALIHLRNGLKPPLTATTGNPYFEWIGADIRSDPWGYAAPGLPEKAAEYACIDATVSHVRNGIYGEMFFSAAIAAAFVESDIKNILQIAATEIPAKSRMAETVEETIHWCETDRDWDKTWHRCAEKYKGMNGVHTLNNACLTIMGLLYGEGDFETTISLTVMGGLDTDCTGASAGSIMGAVSGASQLPEKWVSCFNDRMTTYLNGHEQLRISDLARRSCAIAGAVRAKWA
jgi:ADP-ribosylglycohydrolase